MVQTVWVGVALPEAHADVQHDFAVAVDGPHIVASG